MQHRHHPQFPGHCPFRFPPLSVPSTSGNIPEASQEWSRFASQNSKHEEWNSGLECIWKYSWKAPVIPQCPQPGQWPGNCHRFSLFWVYFLGTPSLPSSRSPFTCVNPPAAAECPWPHKAPLGDLPTLCRCQAVRVSRERQLAEHQGLAWGISGMMLRISIRLFTRPSQQHTEGSSRPPKSCSVNHTWAWLTNPPSCLEKPFQPAC